MKRTLKHTLRRYFNSKPSLNRKAIIFKRSYDEVCRMVDHLACGRSCGKKKK